MGGPPRLPSFAPFVVAAAPGAGLWAGPAMAPAAADVLTPPAGPTTPGSTVPGSTPPPSPPPPPSPTPPPLPRGLGPTAFWLAPTARPVACFRGPGRAAPRAAA